MFGYNPCDFDPVLSEMKVCRAGEYAAAIYAAAEAELEAMGAEYDPWKDDAEDMLEAIKAAARAQEIEDRFFS